ncbi:MAG: AI-2E family transporter [Lactobacillales bacterium]|nr:AI-2E family transporter [Lactobacillales bacterium]
MLFKKENKKKKAELDVRGINEVVSLSKTILKIFTVLLFIVGAYISIIILKELHVKQNVLTILKIISPLFIGFFVAWLFDPFVSMLQRKGVRRTLGTAITYVIFIGIISIILGSLIPLLGDQINDFVKIMPNVFDNIKSWLDGVLNNLKNIDNLDVDEFKLKLFENIESIGTNLTSSLPELTINFVKSLFSGIGNLLVGLIIGFFLLINFNNVSDSVITLFPKKLQSSTRDIFNEINTAFRRFINGALADCSLVFVVSSICFAIAGLQAPLLFGLFCGLTNIIPYAGPYIGGAPAVIVAFSQSTTTGIIVLVCIVVIQLLEGNLIQPLIMSKSAKLHPVTVMIGLLVFGHFFGILGMVIATPVIAACKALILFFDEKYDILNYDR